MDDRDGATLPSYDALPLLDDLRMRHAWGVFGEDDEVGTVNLLTPARIVAAMTEVTRGAIFNLSLPLDLPRGGSRSPHRHTIFNLDRNTQDDVLDNFYLQGSSQWDGLRHVSARSHGYYNDTNPAEAADPAGRLGIGAWADHGIVGRGVLLDVERHLANQQRPLAPTDGFEIGPELLDEVATAQGVSLRDGDVVMVRTGYGALVSDPESRSRPRSWPGLAPTEDMARFLWDRHVAAIVSDNPAVEWAPGDPKEFLHRRLIPLLGMALGELFQLEGLAADCADDGRYTCLFVAVPLNLRAGVGSPANAVAVK
jgi:kynurenine formamidase